MAQLGARLNGIEKVVGSSPTGSTLQINICRMEVVGYLSASWENPV